MHDSFRGLELFCCYSPRDFIVFLQMLELLISLCFSWISPWTSWRKTGGSLSSLVPKAQDSQALALDKLVLRCRERFITARNLENVATPQGSDAGPASQHKSTNLPAWKLEHSLLSSYCDGLSQLISQDIQMLLLWWQSNPSHFDWFVVLFMVSMLARGQRTMTVLRYKHCKSI